jgi:hypothetical protein
MDSAIWGFLGSPTMSHSQWCIFTFLTCLTMESKMAGKNDPWDQPPVNGVVVGSLYTQDSNLVIIELRLLY